MSEEPQPRGRPTTFDQALADRICEGLAEGKSLREICREDGMPAESTVRKWALEDREGFHAHYTRARELGYERMADEIVEIADDGSNDWMERNGKDDSVGYVLNGEHFARSRLRFDARRWLLSKCLPKIYGDKLTQEITGKDGAPLVPAISITVGPASAPQAGPGAPDGSD